MEVPIMNKACEVGDYSVLTDAVERSFAKFATADVNAFADSVVQSLESGCRQRLGAGLLRTHIETWFEEMQLGHVSPSTLDELPPE